ncbi:UDP-N-acetylmuramate dehydrogenase [Leucothrix sargassi]|nr:UDP-N-acetylmuramate dehydrogenase [Leucothrix sargassi]
MQIQKNYPLKALNSFGVAVTADLFTKLTSSADIDQLIQWRKDNPDTDCLLIGGGSNMLFRDDFKGLAVAVCLEGREQVTEDNANYYVKSAAGENWHEFVRWTIDQGYAGLENLSLIPGTVGAAPMQNIGAYGVELADRLHSLSAVDLHTGERREFSNEACQFAYRDSFFKSQQPDRWLIESVTFRLAKTPEWVTAYAGVEAALEGQTPNARLISDTIIALRQSKLPDPNVIGNAGSFFKNPIMPITQWEALKAEFPTIPGYPQKENGELIKTSAGWLIDQCQWKAFREGDAGVYEKHALVLVNHGEASGAELWGLAEEIIASVKDKFGVVLENEPRLIA